MLRVADMHDERQKNQRKAASDSDTDPDDDAEPLGSGPRGRGQPIEVGPFERRRDLVDGVGLCSLGKWAPVDRPVTPSARLNKGERSYCLHWKTYPQAEAVTLIVSLISWQKGR